MCSTEVRSENTAMRCVERAAVRTRATPRYSTTLSRMYTNGTAPLDVHERTLSCFGASAPVLPAIDRIPRCWLYSYIARLLRERVCTDVCMRTCVRLTQRSWDRIAAPTGISEKRPAEGSWCRSADRECCFPD